jgi:hypothetical protein
MAKISVQAGATSVTINVWIESTATPGTGLTGLVFNTANLICYYALPLSTSVAVTLATLAAITTAYASGGFKEVDATNMPGWYRLDLPNAALAAGRWVVLQLQGATNMKQTQVEIELTGWNNQITIPTTTENADALLKRDLTAVTGEAARSPLNALRFLRNKWTVAAGVLTVFKEDDTATAWTGAVTGDAAANPIVSSDPS